MKLNQLTVAILAAGFAAQASAAGFALSEQSVSANGTANAGRASDAVDASVVYNNPAAMHKLKQAQITAGVSFIDADTKIKNQQAAIASGNSKGDIVPHAFIPAGFFTPAIRVVGHGALVLTAASVSKPITMTVLQDAISATKVM